MRSRSILVALALLVVLAGGWLVRSLGARIGDAASTAPAEATTTARADAALALEGEHGDSPALASERAAAVTAEATTNALANPASAAAATRALDVLVTDELGRAVAGVEVTAGQLDETGFQRLVDESMHARTDATGRARIPYEDTPDGRPNRVWLDVTADREPSLAVESRHLAGETLHFVTPLLGTVVVIVTDFDGAPMRDAAQVFVCGMAAGARGKALWGSFASTTCASKPLDGDRARFEHVAVDCELHVSVRREGSQVDHVFANAAPQPRPDSVEIAVRLAPTMPVLAGRVVTPDGAPYARRTLDARLRGDLFGPRDQPCARPQTDAEGAFHFELQSSPAATGDVALALVSTETSAGEYAQYEASVPLELPLANRVVDLGTLVLRPPAVLLAGRVVDARGVPVEDARLELYEPVYLGAQATESSWWSELPFADNVRTDANGEFAVSGSSAASKLAVSARGKDSASSSLEFAPGATGVELALHAFGGLRGRVLFEPPSLANACTLRLYRAGAADADYEHNALAAELESDGRFAFERVAPGTWDARVTRRGDDESLAAAAELRIEEGVVLEDARLNPLDLRGRLQQLHVEAVDTAGARVDGARVAFRPTSGGEAATWRTCELGRGAIELVVSELPLEMRFEARGYLSADLGSIASDVRATLAKAPVLRFVLADPSKLPATPIHLSPVIASLDGSRREQRGNLYFDARGEVQMHAERLGRHRLRWYVVRRDPNMAYGRHFDPPVAFEFDVLPGGASAQIVELDFDAAWMAQQAAALHF